jgi:hypothetical protein
MSENLKRKFDLTALSLTYWLTDEQNIMGTRQAGEASGVRAVKSSTSARDCQLSAQPTKKDGAHRELTRMYSPEWSRLIKQSLSILISSHHLMNAWMNEVSWK